MPCDGDSSSSIKDCPSNQIPRPLGRLLFSYKRCKTRSVFAAGSSTTKFSGTSRASKLSIVRLIGDDVLPSDGIQMVSPTVHHCAALVEIFRDLTDFASPARPWTIRTCVPERQYPVQKP